MQTYATTFSLALALLAFGAVAVQAQQVPQVITYQGTLTDGSGAPIDGTVNLAFQFYPTEGSETPIAGWIERYSSLEVRNGRFSVELGSGDQGLPDGLFQGPELWLEVVVNGEPITRTEMTSSVFALRAEQAAAVANGAVDTDALADGAVDANKIADGVLVRSLTFDDNPPLMDDITFTPGNGVTFSQNENNVTVSAVTSDGGLVTVTSDTTLTGNGTSEGPEAEPLGIANGGVNTAKIVDNSVRSEDIRDGTVAAVDLGSGSVTNAKIDNDAVTSDKVALNSLTHDDIANSAVNTAELADNAVTTEKIANSTITAADIGGNTITGDKLDGGIITSGENITVNRTDGNFEISAPDVLTDADAVTSLGIAGSGTSPLTGPVLLEGGDNIAITNPDGSDRLRIDFDGSLTGAVTSVTGTNGLENLDTNSDGSGDTTGDVQLGVAENAITALELARNAVDETALQQGIVSADRLSATLPSQAGRFLAFDGAVTDSLVWRPVVTALSTPDGNQTGLINIGSNSGTITISGTTDGVIDLSLADKAVTAAKLEPDAPVDASAYVLAYQDGVMEWRLAGPDGEGAFDDGTVLNSSIRWKEDVRTLEDPLALVERLRGVRYRWKESGEADVGVIAEEVAEVLPELVAFEEDGRARGVHYAKLSAVLIEAVKAQEEKIERQQAEIDAMQARFEALAERVARLEARTARPAAPHDRR